MDYYMKCILNTHIKILAVIQEVDDIWFMLDELIWLYNRQRFWLDRLVSMYSHVEEK